MVRVQSWRKVRWVAQSVEHVHTTTNASSFIWQVGVMAARRGHCPEILFEPEPATISQDGQASLSRKSHYLESAGAEPAPATKGVRALYTRTAREDGLFSPCQLPPASMVMICGFVI